MQKEGQQTNTPITPGDDSQYSGQRDGLGFVKVVESIKRTKN